MWGWIKKKVKAVVRVVVRAVIEIVNRLTLGVLDLLFGFIAWPPKRLRLHVFILWSELPPSPDPLPPIEQVIQAAIDRTKKLYKDKFNVNLRPYSKTFMEPLNGPFPNGVLDFKCGIGSEFGDAGEYFAQHLAGWNAIPISFTFPITVFVVRDLTDGALGCSMSVIGDYVVIDRDGLLDNVALAHEIGHSCGLSPGPAWHDWTPSNLMYKESPAGENVKWFQKNILRASRHVQYW
jgi:hypothetical protein